MEIGVAGIVAAVVIGLGFFVWMVSSFYQKCGPNQAMIISGMLSGEDDRKFKIVVGGGVSNVDSLYPSVRGKLIAHVFSDVIKTRVVKNRHGDSSGVRGAAWLFDPRPAA